MRHGVDKAKLERVKTEKPINGCNPGFDIHRAARILPVVHSIIQATNLSKSQGAIAFILEGLRLDRAARE